MKSLNFYKTLINGSSRGKDKELEKMPCFCNLGAGRRLFLCWTFFVVMFGFVLSSMSYGAVIQISSIDDLQKIGNDPNYPLDGEYELTQDIDASATLNWNGGLGFKPIGTSSSPFTGKLDGKGYKITSLYINRPKTDNVGLFGYTGSVSEVNNVRIENCYISGEYNVGGLVGRNYGMVSGSYSTGSVAGYSYVGGLVGWNDGTVSQCYSAGVVAGVQYVGGLVGWNDGTVSGSYSTGSVAGGDWNVGGLVGMNSNSGTVSGSYSTGSVAGVSRVGGLVGWNDGTVSDSYAMGSVSGSVIHIGGLIGYIEGGSVTNTYSTGLVGGSGSNKGGLIGSRDTWGPGTITSSYWDTQTSGMSTSAGGTGRTTAQMKQQSTFSGWDFTTIWGINEGSTYPWLRALGQPQFAPPPVEKNISTLAELNKIGRDWDYPWDGIYHLVNDIDASETVNWDGGKGFKPISTFTGKFYGHGYRILNLYINRPAESYVGLFGKLLYGEVSDLGVENAMVSGDEEVGGLVGLNDGGTVSGCYSTGSVAGGYSVGGLVGYNDRGTVSQCYSTGSVDGYDSVGGLVGYNDRGTVSQCYSTGSVARYEDVGGLVGINGYGGTVTQCYSTASVTGSGNSVGGLVGANDGTVSDSYAMGSVSGSGSDIGGLIGRLSGGSVTNTYSTGLVSGSGNNKGGLIGDRSSSNSGTVTSSYWDTQTSGMSTSAGGEGRTTAQMKQHATYAGWDFVNVWGIEEGVSYPYLLWQGGPIIPEGEGSAHEGATEGTQEGTAEGSGHEGAPEGTQEGTAEGNGHEGAPEGTQEGTAEGSAHEGATEGIHEGATEGSIREGIIEGTKEGEGEGGAGGTDKGCGCNKKAMGGEAWWKYLVDFVLFGLVISLMSGMGKRQKRKE